VRTLGYDECFDTVVDTDASTRSTMTAIARLCYYSPSGVPGGAVVYLRAFSETNLTKANYPIGEGCLL